MWDRIRAWFRALMQMLGLAKRPKPIPSVLGVDEQLYELADRVHLLRRKQAEILSEVIREEDRLLALEEERMYVEAGVPLEAATRCRCGGHCRGKNNVY